MIIFDDNKFQLTLQTFDCPTTRTLQFVAPSRLLLGKLVLGVVEVPVDLKDLVGLLSAHAPLLGEIGLAREDVVGPAIGGLLGHPEFLPELLDDGWIVLLELGEFLKY